MNNYALVENLFEQFNGKYLDENKNFISQPITGGCFVI